MEMMNKPHGEGYASLAPKYAGGRPNILFHTTLIWTVPAKEGLGSRIFASVRVAARLAWPELEARLTVT